MFIAVEGPEGAGKTTLVGQLAERARADGLAVLVAREPGGTATADAARALVLDPTFDWSAPAELFLMLTARAELVSTVLRPALAAGTVVICDRYDLSTRAYQVAGRGLPEEAVLAANRLATGGLQPDLTFVLDIAPDEGRRRQAAQGKEPDRMERADPAMHDRVAAAFRAADGAGVVHLDATAGPEDLAVAVWSVVRQRLDGTA
ncbi:MAG: dTMP kinase [Gemmatimonadales bacterium]|nr:dTMP kinase [Gemmatimonadales bacterium]